ncbi:YopX family protein [Listeria booriae]|uniref:YopX family protein n=1 Tax=Listeria booriae TaxID=1552123 RepID=UPI00162371ED|nr:YopX family protein [Listeria booriae]MBC1982794.1 hypothetical protein [Listeria booriae]
MSREIIYKAKAIASIEELDDIEIKHENGWVYGDLVESYIVNGVLEANDEYITIAAWCAIDLKTVGQYTGLSDKNGNRIYEGDIVYFDGYPQKGKCEVYYSEYAEWCANDYVLHRVRARCEIIGNIHDKPELLEGAAE